ncbi:putative protein without homology [Propionibacterium freudenreichii subsp. shermanii]|nr:putative protein without homology [Propionibacterium freudenreichii subsp. shermanii]
MVDGEGEIAGLGGAHALDCDRRGEIRADPAAATTAKGLVRATVPASGSRMAGRLRCTVG